MSARLYKWTDIIAFYKSNYINCIAYFVIMFYVLNECNIREKLQYAIKVESMFLSKLIVIILLQIIINF